MEAAARTNFDYTGAEGQGWMQEAGFARTTVEHLTGPDSMIVGFKDKLRQGVQRRRLRE